MKPQTTTFNEILTLIHSAKQKAYAQVNSTLIELYWSIGEYISTKTTKENWGKSVVKELAEYIKNQEPNLSGFTARNLWRMKQFYEFYKGNAKVTALLTQLTWTNHLLIISSSKSEEEREFYLLLASQAKYSSRELERQIKISHRLSGEYGKGFSQRNLRSMRSFYLAFPILQTLSAKLSWSHYLLILKVGIKGTRYN